MITSDLLDEKKVVFRDFVPVTLMSGRLCAWDGRTPTDGLYCESNQRRYEQSKLELNRMFTNLKFQVVDKKMRRYTNQFETSMDLVKFCCLETMVRLSSPFSGYYYGSYQDLLECVPYSDSSIKKAVKSLLENNKVELIGSRFGKNIFIVNEEKEEGAVNGRGARG